MLENHMPRVGPTDNNATRGAMWGQRCAPFRFYDTNELVTLGLAMLSGAAIGSWSKSSDGLFEQTQ